MAINNKYNDFLKSWQLTQWDTIQQWEYKLPLTQHRGWISDMWSWTKEAGHEREYSISFNLYQEQNPVKMNL